MAERGDYGENDYGSGNDPFAPPDDPFGGLTGPPLKPGDPGYRLAPWTLGYDPGPNWNNGVGPEGGVWNMGTNVWDTPAAPSFEGDDPPPRDAGPAPDPRLPADPPPNTAPTGAVPSIPAGGAVSSAGPAPNYGGSAQASGQSTRTPNPMQQMYQDALTRFMGRSEAAPRLDDAVLGPQTEVYRAAQQRGQESSRRSAAERAAATGQSESGYLDNLINQGVQGQNFNTAKFNAGLLGGEQDKRREELLSGLRLAAQTGDSEAMRELQGRLGFSDIDLREWMASMGNDQFYDQLGVNTALNMENLNQRALQLIMPR